MSKSTYKPIQKSRYRKIEVRMWGDKKFCELSPIPPSGQGLWVFLLTGPHTGPIPGLFRSGRAAMAEELNWEQEAFDEAFREVLAQGMAQADWKAKVVWIPKAISCNKPESPNVVLSWGNEWDLIPECDLKLEAYESLKASIHALGEGFAKAFDKAFEKPSAKAIAKPSGKAIANQEQEQEQEQNSLKDLSTCVDDGHKTALALVPTVPPAEPPKNPIAEIFAYWQKRMDSPRSKLDDKRHKAIKAALKMGYTPADLCRAIRGCSLTPHNMGKNDQNQKYNGIELILRSADQIDRFIANDAELPGRASSLNGTGIATGPDATRQRINDEAKKILFGTQPAGEVIDAQG